MRTFDQLIDSEKHDAIEHCKFIVLELVYDGILFVPNLEVSKKVEMAQEESEDFSAFLEHPFITSGVVSIAVDEWAEAMAMDSEYPSKNEDGTYKRVIQL